MADMSEEKRLRVCWLVPGFAESEDDPRYSFLRREAHELVEFAEDVELTVVVEAPWKGDQVSGFSVECFTRPTTPFSKGGSVFSALRADPRQLLNFVRAPRRSYPTLWRIASLVTLLRELRPDVVHSHFAVPGGTCGVSIARCLSAAIVVSLRGVDVAVVHALDYGFRLDPGYDSAIRRSLPKVDLCLTATRQMRAAAVSAGALESRAVVLPNSISPSGRSDSQRVQRPAGAVRVSLSVGDLTERKGFDRGIRALAHLPLDHHYVVVGEGAERGPLTRLAGVLGVADRTHLLGELSPSEVRAWMADADCYWFLSRFEGFGNVLLEAFAAGAAIVATTEGAAPELSCSDGSIEMLLEPDDPQELARLTELVSTEVRVESRAEELMRFSPSLRSESLLELYRISLSNRRETLADEGRRSSRL